MRRSLLSRYLRRVTSSKLLQFRRRYTRRDGGSTGAHTPVGAPAARERPPGTRNRASRQAPGLVVATRRAIPLVLCVVAAISQSIAHRRGMSRTEPAGHQERLEGADASTRNRLRRAVQAILWLLMDSPAFPAGHSGLDPYAAAPAARPVPDGSAGRAGVPAGGTGTRARGAGTRRLAGGTAAPGGHRPGAGVSAPRPCAARKRRASWTR